MGILGLMSESGTMSRILGAFALLTVFAVGSASAQDYTLYFTDDADLMGPSGTSIQIECLLDVAAGATPVQGWSFGICHDFTEVLVTGTTDGATMMTSNEGGPVDFAQTAFYEGDATTAGGVTTGVVICLLQCATLPAGANGYELLLVDYDLVAPNGTISQVSYCDTADQQVPGQPATVTTVVANGQAVPPLILPANVTIDVVPFELGFTPIAPVSQGDTAEVPVTLANSQDVYGFSFGLGHDGGALDIAAVDPGPAIATINAGAAPDFFFADLNPMGGTGFTLGAVFSFAQETVLAPGLHEIVLATYDVLGSAPTGDTVLSFVETLSPPAPAPPVAIRISIGEEAVVPTLTTGLVTVEAGGIQFIRGDSNSTGGIDISDGISLLEYLFSGGVTPPCLDASDFDNSGGVDVADAISILGYLFSMGPDPAAPFHDCGLDAEGDTDGVTCLSSSACP